MNAKEFFDKTTEPLSIEQLMEQYAEHRLENQILWGVFDGNKVMSIHLTEEGALKNLSALEKEPFSEYNELCIDILTVHK